MTKIDAKYTTINLPPIPVGAKIPKEFTDKVLSRHPEQTRQIIMRGEGGTTKHLALGDKLTATFVYDETQELWYRNWSGSTPEGEK